MSPSSDGRARRAGQPLPTLTVEADVRFRSAEDRGRFAEELSHCHLTGREIPRDRAPRDGRAFFREGPSDRRGPRRPGVRTPLDAPRVVLFNLVSLDRDPA